MDRSPALNLENAAGSPRTVHLKEEHGAESLEMVHEEAESQAYF